MQSFPKQKKKKRAKKKEPERPSIMHSRESGTCYLCMKLHNDYRRHPALQEHHIFGGCPNRTHSPDQSDESQNNRIALTVHQFRQNNFLHLMVAGFHQSHPFELIFLFQFLGHSRVLEQLR